MPPDERQERALQLAQVVEREDINDWLCRQLKTVSDLHL